VAVVDTAALSDTIKRAIEYYVVAHIADIHAAHDGRGPLYFHDNTYHKVDNILKNSYNAGATFPVATRPTFRSVFIDLFLALVNGVRAGGKLHSSGAIVSFASFASKEAAAFRGMLALTSASEHLIASDNVTKDCNYIFDFAKLFTDLLGDCREYANPGSYEIANVYLKFLKVVSWHIATAACVYGKFVCNSTESLYVITAAGVTVGARGRADVQALQRYARELLLPPTSALDAVNVTTTVPAIPKVKIAIGVKAPSPVKSIGIPKLPPPRAAAATAAPAVSASAPAAPPGPMMSYDEMMQRLQQQEGEDATSADPPMAEDAPIESSDPLDSMIE
jgi:hypothetical protein